MNINISPLDMALIALCIALVILIIYLIITVNKLSKTMNEVNTLLKDVQTITEDNTKNINSIIENVEHITSDAVELTNKVNSSVKGIETALKTPLDDPSGIMEGTMKVKKVYSTAKNVMFAAMVVKDFFNRRKEKKLRKKLYKQ
ncbi:DUF948 domain-containing protein [Anaerofustis stercorihominis]|uniref:DUF948 domain-containing protein n=1 Tax=Anaerofustis stercorihominis DSM 17244 TaxID=445971 RepID=B1C972_9FIRM|nr:DUF948 domain-containing protein [Anaerofustis stercorihominis]EDS72236.1 hypothetical protein ANASTE_01946 [Anaerofustis stercorihominis DSM 17244]MCQ4795164.1 DUF948 domain-containing protein [Anaerofustis stercorihominis]